MMHLRMAHLFYHYQIKPKKNKKRNWEKLLMLRKSLHFTVNQTQELKEQN